MLMRLWNKLTFAVKRRQVETDLDEELAFHREMLESHLERGGTTQDDAARHARRRMGNVTMAHEDAREAWMFRWLDVLARDVRYSLRTFARNPGFTAVALLTLALGIGANAALFRLVDAVMLRSLPVQRPEELIVIHDDLFSYPVAEDLRARTDAFVSMFAAHTMRDVELRVADPNGGTSSGVPPTTLASVELVSGNYFSMLGVTPTLGRQFAPDDDRVAEGSPVAVISHNLWTRAFNRSPAVLGQTIHLRGGLLGDKGTSGFEAPVASRASDVTTLTIIGVAPPEFFGDAVGSAIDVWTPITMQPSLMTGRAWLTRRTAYWLRVMGRLRPGVTDAQASAATTTLLRQILTEERGATITPRQKESIARATWDLQPGATGFARLRTEFSQPLLVLMTVVALVLLIACLNIANLLLARATARQHEISMRLSLGASRARLIGQLLTESLLLAFAGGALAIGVALVGTRVLVTMVSSESRPIALPFELDWRMLAFTAGASILSGILFGLAPAWRGTGVGLQTTLRETGRGTTGGGRRVVKALVATQVGVSLVLLVAAILFLRTLYNLQSQQVGYDREGLVIVKLDPLNAGYRGEAIGRAMLELMHRFAAVPGVRATTFSENGLFSGSESLTFNEIEGFRPARDEDLRAYFDQVGPQYFSKVGIPILLGRELDERDRPGAPRATVINETMATFYFGSANPIGKHVRGLSRSTEPADLEIVGVVRDAQDHNFRSPPVRRYYVSYLNPIDGLTVVNFEVRVAQHAGAVMPALRQTVRQFDPKLQVLSVKSVQSLMDESIVTERLVAKLSSFFGLLAVMLAAIGLYGVMSYAVSLRTNEIGIRMALGARTAAVSRMILIEISVLVLCGVVVGAAAAFGVTRYAEALVFGLTPSDPLTFAAAAALLLLVGLAAGYLPARRASRIDPLIALRSE